MQNIIEETSFGSIKIDGKEYNYDIVIEDTGKIRKRNKELSKAEQGSSHIFSLKEAKDIYKNKVRKVIIGAGQSSRLSLSQEAASYFQKEGCTIKLLSTPKAIELWNNNNENAVGVFHLTC